MRMMLPDPLSETLEHDISACADAIFGECRSRISLARTDGRQARAGGETLDWLRPRAYTLIAFCLERNVQHVLYRRSIRAGRLKHGSQVDLNVFHLGLVGMFAENPKLLNRDELQDTGRVLWHAYRNYVPAEFVNGFRHQVGKLSLERAGSIEEDFYEWIITKRFMDFRVDKVRGAYPDEIYQGVRAMRQKHLPSFANLFGKFNGSRSGEKSDLTDFDAFQKRNEYGDIIL